MKKRVYAGVSSGYALLKMLWIYLSVGEYFLRWRFQLWFQRYHMIESKQNSMKQTLLFVRHGQTTWNVEHRLPGQLPGIALTEVGREQAVRLAEALASLPISAVISSPLERAYDTAEYIARGHNLEIQLEPDLMDTDIGHWAGKVIEELSKNDPAWKAYVKDPTVAPEGVETFPQVQRRAVAAVERWCANESIGLYPIFVAHADVIKLLVAHYTGLEAGRAGSLLIDNASVSVVEIEKEHGSRVLAIGWSPRPGWLKPPVPQEVPREAERAQGEVPREAERAQEVGEQKT